MRFPNIGYSAAWKCLGCTLGSTPGNCNPTDFFRIARRMAAARSSGAQRCKRLRVRGEQRPPVCLVEEKHGAAVARPLPLHHRQHLDDSWQRKLYGLKLSTNKTSRTEIGAGHNLWWSRADIVALHGESQNSWTRLPINRFQNLSGYLPNFYNPRWFWETTNLLPISSVFCRHLIMIPNVSK